MRAILFILSFLTITIASFGDEIINQNELIGKWIIKCNWQSVNNLIKPDNSLFIWCEGDCNLSIDFIDQEHVCLQLNPYDLKQISRYELIKNKFRGYLITIILLDQIYELNLLKSNIY